MCIIGHMKCLGEIKTRKLLSFVEKRNEARRRAESNVFSTRRFCGIALGKEVLLLSNW